MGISIVCTLYELLCSSMKVEEMLDLIFAFMFILEYFANGTASHNISHCVGVVRFVYKAYNTRCVTFLHSGNAL